MTIISVGRVRIRYNKEMVKAKLAAASALAIDYTLGKCVWRARMNHEYLDRTGFLTASTTIYDFAKEVAPDIISGRWGAHANYSLYVEIGTSRPDSGAPRAQVRAEEGHGDMWSIPPPQPPGRHTDTRWVTTAGVRQKIMGGGPLMEARVFLRSAAAMEYPLLGFRIRAALHGEELE